MSTTYKDLINEAIENLIYDDFFPAMLPVTDSDLEIPQDQLKTITGDFIFMKLKELITVNALCLEPDAKDRFRKEFNMNADDIDDIAPKIIHTSDEWVKNCLSWLICEKMICPKNGVVPDSEISAFKNAVTSVIKNELCQIQEVRDEMDSEQISDDMREKRYHEFDLFCSSGRQFFRTFEAQSNNLENGELFFKHTLTSFINYCKNVLTECGFDKAKIMSLETQAPTKVELALSLGLLSASSLCAADKKGLPDHNALHDKFVYMLKTCFVHEYPEMTVDQDFNKTVNNAYEAFENKYNLGRWF